MSSSAFVVIILSSLLAGCLLAAASAYFLCSLLLYHINDFGDSEGDYQTFAKEPMQFLYKKDDCKKEDYDAMRR